MSFQIISKFISRGFWDRNQILNADSYILIEETKEKVKEIKERKATA